jgi:hypothetical protein
MNSPRTLALATTILAVLAVPHPAHPVTLAEAYQALASRRFVDLTHAFGPRSPV